MSLLTKVGVVIGILGLLTLIGMQFSDRGLTIRIPHCDDGWSEGLRPTTQRLVWPSEWQLFYRAQTPDGLQFGETGSGTEFVATEISFCSKDTAYANKDMPYEWVAR